MDASRHRAEPNPACPYCQGSGIVSISKDPDEVTDCVCTDMPLSAEDRVNVVESRLGIELMPWQREWVLRALDGETAVTVRARRSGWKTIARVVKEAQRV